MSPQSQHGVTQSAELVHDSSIFQAARDIRGGVHIYSPTTAAQAMDITVSSPLGRLDPNRPLRGRDQIVNDLVSVLESSEQSQRIRVLAGLGGSGKTSIALAVAEKAKQLGITTWWVEATDRNAMGAKFQAVARKLGAAADALAVGNTADQLWELLIKRSEPWLLVVDNADDAHLLAIGDQPLSDGVGWVRPLGTSPGMVIVTSRDADASTWGSWSVVHKIPTLELVPAAQVLLDLTQGRGGTREDATSLAARLGGLPLALWLVGSYLADTTSIPWRDIDTLTSFREYELALDNDSDAINEARDTLTRTWLFSLKLLEARGLKHTTPLLHLLACFGAGPIPYQSLLKPQALASSTFFSGIASRTLWDSLKSLQSLGLLEFSDDNTSPIRLLQLHPLVRDATGRHAENLGQKTAYLALAASLLLDVTEGDLPLPDEPTGWPIWRAVTPHGFNLMQSLQGMGEASEGLTTTTILVAISCCKFVMASGQLKAGEAAFRQLWDFSENRLGREHRVTRRVRYAVGQALHDLDLNREALKVYSDLVESEQEEYGAASRAALITWGQKLHVLRCMGKAPMALKEFRERYHLADKEYGPDDATTLHAREEMILAEAQIDREEAIVALKELQSHIERIRGEDDREAVMLDYTVASYLLTCDRLSEAEEAFDRALVRHAEIRGKDHPHSLLIQYDRILVWRKVGNVARAEREYKKIIQARQDVLGSNHPSTLDAEQSLANLYHQEKRWDEAESLLASVVSRMTRLFGKTHLQTLVARESLAHLHGLHLGRQVEAERDLREIFNAKRKILGDKDARTLKSRFELGRLLRSQGRKYEADQLGTHRNRKRSRGGKR